MILLTPAAKDQNTVEQREDRQDRKPRCACQPRTNAKYADWKRNRVPISRYWFYRCWLRRCLTGLGLRWLTLFLDSISNPNCRIVASSSHCETNWTLIGKFSELNEYGTESAGRPAKLKGTVARIMCVDGTFSPLTTYSSNPGGGACGRSGLCFKRTSLNSRMLC